MKLRTGLLAPCTSVEAPIHTGLRLTTPAREALTSHGNMVVREDGPTAAPRFTVTLRGTTPAGLVLCLIGHKAESCRGLRLQNEPPYPQEWPASVIAWYEQGDWTGCPQCSAPLVWYEAGYVPGYRVCSRSPHHHARLAPDGKSATLVR